MSDFQVRFKYLQVDADTYWTEWKLMAARTQKQDWESSHANGSMKLYSVYLK